MLLSFEVIATDVLITFCQERRKATTDVLITDYRCFNHQITDVLITDYRFFNHRNAPNAAYLKGFFAPKYNVKDLLNITLKEKWGLTPPERFKKPL